MSNSKYVIELEDVYVNGSKKAQEAPERLYKVKGFNTLVFDENGLKKLKKVSDDNNEINELKEQINILNKKLAEAENKYAEGYQAGRKSVYDLLEKVTNSYEKEFDVSKEKSCDKCKSEKSCSCDNSDKRVKKEIFDHFYGVDMFDSFPSFIDLILRDI